MSPNYKVQGLKEDIKKYNRETYAKAKDVVESKLNKWANQEYDAQGNLIQKDEINKKNDKEPAINNFKAKDFTDNNKKTK